MKLLLLRLAARLRRVPLPTSLNPAWHVPLGRHPGFDPVEWNLANDVWTLARSVDDRQHAVYFIAERLRALRRPPAKGPYVAPSLRGRAA